MRICFNNCCQVLLPILCSIKVLDKKLRFWRYATRRLSCWNFLGQNIPFLKNSKISHFKTLYEAFSPFKISRDKPFSASSESGFIYVCPRPFATIWLLGFDKSHCPPDVQLNYNHHLAPQVGDNIGARNYFLY